MFEELLNMDINQQLGGQRQPRKDKVPANQKRVFNGETFVLEAETNLKSDAERRANQFRNAGFKARVIKSGNRRYKIYSGPKMKRENKDPLRSIEDFGMF
jgi:hypothetical protein